MDGIESAEVAPDPRRVTFQGHKKIFCLLLVTSSLDDAKHLSKLLSAVTSMQFDISHIKTQKEMLVTLKAKNYDIVLLDLQLDASDGATNLVNVLEAGFDGCVIILSDQDDEALETHLFQLGAQEFLNKLKITSQGIGRAIRHAHDRHQSMRALECGREALQELVGPVEGALGLLETREDLIRENIQLASKIKVKNDQLTLLALTDALTELPNRLHFDKHFQEVLAHSKRHKHMFALMMIDLDGFKKINDTLGHQAGDSVLHGVAKRLLTRLRTSDFLARMGGDEFAVILPEINSEHVAGIVAHKLLKSLEVPFSIADTLVEVGASIGIACYPTAAEEGNDLMKKADFAMYSAKKTGGYNYQYSNSELHAQHLRRLKLEEALGVAIEKKQMFLNFQPIVRLASGKMDGMEVLLRWQHPDFGLVSPDEFIPIAEDNGMIIMLGEWVLGSACEQFSKWYRAGHKNYKLSVNLSPRQLMSEELGPLVERTLHKNAMPSHNLELEVTEMAVMAEGNYASALLQHLHKLGASSSMDDFGTGYSSLSRLKSLPISTLKIDRSFISGIGQGSDDEVIVNSIIALAQKLGMGIIAEGIETDAQRDFLIQNGCQRGQGYYFSRPLMTEQMEEYLQANGY